MVVSVVLGAIVAFLTSVLGWLFLGGKKLVPGPWNLPIVGYLPFMSRSPHLDFERLIKKFGNIFGVRLGSNYVVVVNDYQSTKEAFALDAFIGRPPDSPFEFTKESMETHAFDGPPWKEQRRFALHTLRDLGLGKSKMEVFIQDEIEEFLDYLNENVKKPFFVRDRLITSMSNNIASLVFGKRLKYDHPDRQRLNKVFHEITANSTLVSWFIFFPWLKRVMEKLGLGNLKRLSELNQVLKDYLIKEIEEHEATLDPDNIRDFIDAYMLESRRRKNEPAFCKKVLEDLVGAFFGAGSETVVDGIEWLMLVSAVHQDRQKRVQAEIDEVIGRDRFPQFPDKSQMPFTDAFISELLRWRTILPLNLMRYTIEDTELGGYPIPKGTHVLSNIWAVHHNRGYWGEDADEFRPERFLNEDNKTFKKWEHFMPFSTGKRQCPGEPLARVELFLYFTAILQKFHIRLPEGAEADFEGLLGLGLQPKPHELILTRR